VEFSGLNLIFAKANVGIAWLLEDLKTLASLLKLVSVERRVGKAVHVNTVSWQQKAV
jgi:hypothetical protein